MFWKDARVSRSRPLVIGHRGAPLEHVENTLRSYIAAVGSGADALEIDVQLTCDGHVVCCHDPDLERITGIKFCIHDNTLAACRSVFPEIATLAEVCLRLPSAGILIDTKIDPSDLIGPLEAICADTASADRVMVGATSASHADRLKSLCKFPVCGLFTETTKVGLYQELSVVWVRLHGEQYKAGVADAFRSAGISTMMLANVDGRRGPLRIAEEDELRLGLALNCDAFLVDNPGQTGAFLGGAPCIGKVQHTGECVGNPIG